MSLAYDSLPDIKTIVASLCSAVIIGYSETLPVKGVAKCSQTNWLLKIAMSDPQASHSILTVKINKKKLMNKFTISQHDALSPHENNKSS